MHAIGVLVPGLLILYGKTLALMLGSRSLKNQVVNMDTIQRNASNAHGKHPLYTQLPGNPVVSGGGLAVLVDKK